MLYPDPDLFFRVLILDGAYQMVLVWFHWIRSGLGSSLEWESLHLLTGLGRRRRIWTLEEKLRLVDMADSLGDAVGYESVAKPPWLECKIRWKEIGGGQLQLLIFHFLSWQSGVEKKMRQMLRSVSSHHMMREDYGLNFEKSKHRSCIWDLAFPSPNYSRSFNSFPSLKQENQSARTLYPSLQYARTL